MVYAGPDARYTGRQICFGSNTDTLTIIDVTDKNNIVQVSRTSYAGVGYTHQGWLTADQRYFFMLSAMLERELYSLSDQFHVNPSYMKALVRATSIAIYLVL